MTTDLRIPRTMLDTSTENFYVCPCQDPRCVEKRKARQEVVDASRDLVAMRDSPDDRMVIQGLKKVRAKLRKLDGERYAHEGLGDDDDDPTLALS